MAIRGRPGVVMLVVLASVAALPARQDADPNLVRARMHTYLTTYEQDLSTLVAEERLSQWPLRGGSSLSGGSNPGSYRLQQQRDSSRIRRMVSDVAFVPLPGNVGWLGYRDVLQIGGRPVRRVGPSLVDLLKAQTDDSRERAMTLLLESAKHNLGAARTINLPSLPLELLHGRNQARFVITAHEMDRAGGCAAMRLLLEETVTPTLIQRPEGGNMPSAVAAWVEPETGRLCKAEVKTRDGRLGVPPFTAIVTVEFAHDTGLGLTVPTRMEEVFFIPPRGRGEGEAVYSNYRRFATSGRMVPPPGAHER